MEARIAKLEASIEHIERDVNQLRPDMANVRERLAVLEERVSHLPGKGFIVASTLGGLAAITAILSYIEQIRGFLAGL